MLGDPRTNQNPAFLALGILFFRWHNVLASRIKKRYPLWRDEDVFQAARRWNIASLQVICNTKHRYELFNISTIMIFILIGMCNFISITFLEYHRL